MDFFGQLRAFSFITEGLIPFIVQFIALSMQRLVEVPLSAVVGRRVAALAMEKGFYQKGVEWLEQCLMLVWGRLSVRAPQAVLDDADAQSVLPQLEGGMEQMVLAFLGLCIYADMTTEDGPSVAYPEQIAYFIIQEWIKRRSEVYENPVYRDLFKPHSFSHILNAARTAPVVMLNLWGSQCNALLLLGEDGSKCIHLPGVTEEFVATLQTLFREGLQTNDGRSRGDEVADEHRGAVPVPDLSVIHRCLSALWKKVVKPILDEMELKVRTRHHPFLLNMGKLSHCPHSLLKMLHVTRPV
jgi:hypothetical protein